LVKEGYTPEWTSPPPLKVTQVSSRTYRQDELHTYNTEIGSLLKSGAIEEMDPNTPCFVSRFFLIPKKNGKIRPIIDLRRLNQFVKYYHFKMEGIELVKSLVRRGDFMVTLDLNQAFYHVPLARDQRKYFAFDFMEKRYCFNCLPFGLSSSPRIFTKILRPVIKLAREKGIRLIVYLDDILILASSKEMLNQQSIVVLDLLQQLGFTINKEKSSLIPSQVVDYLGFQINSRSMMIKLPKFKVKDLIRECKKMKEKKVVPVRKLAALIEKISATANAIFPARLNSRALLRDKITTIKKKGWNSQATLSLESLNQLDWWIEKLPHWNGKSLIPEVPKTTLYTDASISGWGATRENCVIYGRWLIHEQSLHINALELSAIMLAIKTFKDIQNQTVLIRTDNMTSVAYINHQGGTTSKVLSTIAESLWKLCLNRNIHLKADHVPGVMNSIADRASRMEKDRFDWKLHPEIFNALNKIWGPHQIDLFASRHNTQLQRFYAWTPDPEAEAIDAFQQKWSKLNTWANPPWVLIPRILSKVIREKATMTILVPWWESAPWFPLIMDLLIEPPILILQKDIIQNELHHQENPFRNQKWRILACRISGLGTKIKVFRKKLLNYSWHHWISILQKQYPPISKFGFLGVEQEQLIPLLAI
jgi:ribonuclease HI